MIITIFSGYNQRAVITFLRTLNLHNLDFAIIAKSENDSIFKSIYKDKVVAIRTKKELDFQDIKDCILSVKKIDSDVMIVPSTEALNRFYLDNKDFFKHLSCFMPIVDKQTYELFSDKIRFTQFCKEFDIDVPQEVACDKKNIPFVAKPKYYQSSDNKIYSPIIINNDEDYDKFLNQYNLSDFYYQEFIEGHSYYLLYYAGKNSNIIKYSQENIIQQTSGKSIVAAISSNIHNSLISQKFETLIKNIKFFGLLMIEIRKKDEEYYMIEANPRFWGPSQLFFDANINFFEYFLKDNGFNISINEEKIKDVKYFWNGGYNPDIVYFNKQYFIDHNKDFFLNEIYNREDTKNIYNLETTNKLYKEYSIISKHSHYQILDNDIQKYFADFNINVKSRYEKERFDYLKKYLTFKTTFT